MITDWKALVKKMQAARQAQNLTIDQLAETTGNESVIPYLVYPQYRLQKTCFLESVLR